MLKKIERPAIVLRNAKTLESQLTQYPDRRQRAADQAAAAQTELSKKTDAIDRQIESREKRIEEITANNIRWRGKTNLDREKARRDLREEIRRLRQERQDWMSGRR